MANKKISELPTGSTPTGPELIEAVQGGVNVKLTAQEIADLGAGGLTEADLTASRTVSSASATIQADNLNIIYADSASPFDITVDLLSAGTQVMVINIGSATATLIEGAGVTLLGTSIAIGSGENALIIYRVPATPEVYTGSTAVGTVTSVGFTGGLISVATPTTTPALTVAGTSGGVPYFSSASTWASSAALAANALVVGGGAGSAPATVTTGTGVVTALGVNVGSPGALVTNGAVWLLASGGALTADNAITGAFKVGFNNKGVEINQTAQSSSWLPTIKVLNGAHTALSANTPFVFEDYGTSSPATETWLTGTVPAQIDRQWRGLIHSGANPTTFTRLIGNQFDVPTVTGAGVTSTNAFALASNGPFVAYSGDGSTERFKVQSTGVVTIGTAFTFTPSASLVIAAGLGLGLSGQAANSEGRISGVKEVLSTSNNPINFITNAFTNTSGSHIGYDVRTGFAPTSGTADFRVWTFTGTVNQTGGANGAFSVLNVQPTYTAAGGNVTGIDYNPTVTSISGTHTGLRVRLGNVLFDNANVTLGTAGNGVLIKTGSNATAGTGTLVGGTLTVNTTKTTASSMIFLTSQSDGGAPGFLRITARSAGTSFTVTSSSGTDTSTFAWWILEPAP